MSEVPKTPKKIAIRFYDNDFTWCVVAYLKLLLDYEKSITSKEIIVKSFNTIAPALHYLKSSGTRLVASSYLHIDEKHVLFDEEVDAYFNSSEHVGGFYAEAVIDFKHFDPITKHFGIVYTM